MQHRLLRRPSPVLPALVHHLCLLATTDILAGGGRAHPQGELLFHYTQIALDGTRRKELRLWFEKGAVIRVQDGASVIDTPAEAHQAQGARAKLAAQRWLGWYRDLRAVKVALP